ncbi:molybdopterin oxidoreductase family protein [Cytobacillus firmus]|uniref:Molybdopterin-dependent oxidoreductase n=1 Tax=Cytobacillus firmus TaxID=1399 RepID=A0AA46SMD1_CYTFI|nr:molybdopterin-dependent oxidoreductase [Cytobacillus firmus]UYG98240.1 molybdopterin-dependent oxidoreductase [Cytobacillus firmus]
MDFLNKKVTRRQALKVIGSTAAAGASSHFLLNREALADEITRNNHELENSLPIPPATAQKFTTSCQYCSVGCGYQVTVWPISQTEVSGGTWPKLSMGEPWTSPETVAATKIDGEDCYITIVPDQVCVVNKGDHSIRGGTNALTTYSDAKQPLMDTSNRCKMPKIKKNGKMIEVSWDEALDLIADKMSETIKKDGPGAIGIWQADHETPENNYVGAKFAFSKYPKGIYDPNLPPEKGIPHRAIHNRPKFGSETPAFGDIFGSNEFMLYSYEDAEIAEVVILAGANAYETASAFYNRIYDSRKDGKKLIVIDPRKTITSRNAEENGYHLQLAPGTDVILINSIMHHIIENGWEDTNYINKRIDSVSFENLKKTVMAEKYRPENAEIITKVPAATIKEAAKLISSAKGVTTIFEKGIIWQGTQNTECVGVYANLNLITGNVGIEGGSIGRLGGHQEAILTGVPHPQENSEDRPDVWNSVVEGKLKMLWIIDSNPMSTTQQTNAFSKGLEKVDFLIVNEIYENETTEYADVILPSAAWGEWDYIRVNLERRLKMYSKFTDSPGEAKPDWEIIAMVARRLGERHGLIDPYEYKWKNSAEVFEEYKHTNDGKHLGLNMVNYQWIRELGSDGIQIPLIEKEGNIIGTNRLYTEHFHTKDGKARVQNYDVEWEGDVPIFLPDEIRPNKNYPFYLTTVRHNVLWQCGYTFRWIPHLVEMMPEPEVQIHPEDAKNKGIKNGDWIKISNQFGETEAIASVTDIVPVGVLSVVFAYPFKYINNLSASIRSKRNGAYFKNTRANIEKINKPDIKNVTTIARR